MTVSQLDEYCIASQIETAPNSALTRAPQPRIDSPAFPALRRYAMPLAG